MVDLLELVDNVVDLIRRRHRRVGLRRRLRRRLVSGREKVGDRVLISRCFGAVPFRSVVFFFRFQIFNPKKVACFCFGIMTIFITHAQCYVA